MNKPCVGINIGKEIKNIIFDLDGTITDSMYVWKGTARKFLNSNNVFPPDNFEKTIERMSLEQTFEYYITNFGLKQTKEEMLKGCIALIKHEYEHNVQLKENVLNFLKCAKKNNIKMCILSASEEELIVVALKRLEILDYFDNIYTCTALGMSKSSGEIYSFVANKNQMEKSETAVFEDAFHGVENAKKENFYVVAVEDESAIEYKEEIKKVADLYICNYGEIMQF